jgi:hypothetical protein
VDDSWFGTSLALRSGNREEKWMSGGLLFALVSSGIVFADPGLANLFEKIRKFLNLSRRVPANTFAFQARW